MTTRTAPTLRTLAATVALALVAALAGSATAIADTGESEPSDPSVVGTGDEVSPFAPRNPRVVRAANGGVERVEWDRPLGLDGPLRYWVVIDYTEAPLLGGPATPECLSRWNAHFCDDIAALDPDFGLLPPPGTTLHVWVEIQSGAGFPTPPSEKVTIQF